MPDHPGMSARWCGLAISLLLLASASGCSSEDDCSKGDRRCLGNAQLDTCEYVPFAKNTLYEGWFGGSHHWKSSPCPEGKRCSEEKEGTTCWGPILGQCKDAARFSSRCDGPASYLVCSNVDGRLSAPGIIQREQCQKGQVCRDAAIKGGSPCVTLRNWRAAAALVVAEDGNARRQAPDGGGPLLRPADVLQSPEELILQKDALTRILVYDQLLTFQQAGTFDPFDLPESFSLISPSLSYLQDLLQSPSRSPAPAKAGRVLLMQPRSGETLRALSQVRWKCASCGRVEVRILKGDSELWAHVRRGSCDYEGPVLGGGDYTLQIAGQRFPFRIANSELTFELDRVQTYLSEGWSRETSVALWAAVLFHAGKFTDALQALDEGIAAQPSSKVLPHLKHQYASMMSERIHP